MIDGLESSLFSVFLYNHVGSEKRIQKILLW